MLKNLFSNCCKNYTSDEVLVESFWVEIESAYSNKKRFYHNLTHLQNLFIQLKAIKTEIKNWDAVLFAVFYHDIVYNILKKNNEGKSASVSRKRLQAIGCTESTIVICESIILATQKHELHINSDVNYFTDADLSILGKDWYEYKSYADNVRKEYAVFPDIIYKPGRKKVLEHFLSMKQIFKTNYFFTLLEENTKNNLRKELELLS